MPWTKTNRKHYQRKSKRYSSDVTNEEWAVISPLLPGPNRLGRPRKVDLREVWNAIGYLAASGCAWALLPKDFPAISAVRYCFYHWRNTGLLREINRRLVAMVREAVGRDSCPTAGVIDSQSVKTSENTSLRIRCRQEDQGPQAPHHGRYLRQSVGALCSYRRHSGS